MSIKRKKVNFTQQELQDDLEYKSGVLYWRKPGKGKRKNKVAGCHNKVDNYYYVWYKGNLWGRHKLTWFYFNNDMPDYLDHINGIQGDDRIENLQDISQSENLRKQKDYKNNTTGHKGITKKGDKFRADISVDNTQYYLGLYDDIEDAIDAREEAKSILW